MSQRASQPRGVHSFASHRNLPVIRTRPVRAVLPGLSSDYAASLPPRKLGSHRLHASKVRRVLPLPSPRELDAIVLLPSLAAATHTHRRVPPRCAKHCLLFPLAFFAPVSWPASTLMTWLTSFAVC